MKYKNFHKNNNRTTDYKLIFLILLLSVIGCSLLYSAGQGMQTWALKQMTTIVVCTPLMLIVGTIRPNIIFRYSYHFYFLCILLLIVAAVMGYKAMGAQRWVRIGSFNWQPSELMKVSIILILAKYFHRSHSTATNDIKMIIIPLLIIALPVIFILKQPNLGTAVVVTMIGSALIFITGVHIAYFLTMITLVAISLPIFWIFFMHTYQKQRILTFLNPEQDLLGSGYNIMQSKIAIGSGHILGKGFGQGSQTQLHFLPEKHTDFIFTVLAEEMGFIGCIFLLLLFFILVIYGYKIAFSCRNHFSRLIAIGVSTSLFIHVFINIAMVSGLIPVVGIPLPFLSYGGSNMLAMFLSFGLLLNCYMHGHKTRLN